MVVFAARRTNYKASICSEKMSLGELTSQNGQKVMGTVLGSRRAFARMKFGMGDVLYVVLMSLRLLLCALRLFVPLSFSERSRSSLGGGWGYMSSLYGLGWGHVATFLLLLSKSAPARPSLNKLLLPT